MAAGGDVGLCAVPGVRDQSILARRGAAPDATRCRAPEATRHPPAGDDPPLVCDHQVTDVKRAAPGSPVALVTCTTLRRCRRGPSPSGPFGQARRPGRALVAPRCGGRACPD